MDVCLVAARCEDKPVIQRLMEIFSHDHSEFDHSDVNEHGLYEYEYTDAYWVEPERHPFLIRVDGKIAGFALVRKLGEQGGLDSHSVAEFFIMRKFRRAGAGGKAARLLFDSFPGRWRVCQVPDNAPAHSFWGKVIGNYTQDHFRDYYEDDDRWVGSVQEFITPGLAGENRYELNNPTLEERNGEDTFAAIENTCSPLNGGNNMDFTLEQVKYEDKPVLRNLSELYVYDFTEFTGRDISEHGCYSYGYIDQYWTEDGRYPYFIRVEGKLAGFVLVHRLDDAPDGTPVNCISEFFIMRKYRRSGLGSRVAKAVFDMFSGVIMLDEIESNAPAQVFWHKVLDEYTGGSYEEKWEGEPGRRALVQTFRTPTKG
jgi:predicted acetyltransferase